MVPPPNKPACFAKPTTDKLTTCFAKPTTDEDVQNANWLQFPVVHLGLEEGGLRWQIKKHAYIWVKLRLFCISEHLNCNVYIKVQCVGHILADGEYGTIHSYECAN